VRPARKTDLTAISESTVLKCGLLDVSQSYAPPRPVIKMALLTYYLYFFLSCVVDWHPHNMKTIAVCQATSLTSESQSEKLHTKTCLNNNNNNNGNL
jgi:hypothetical protein